MVLAWAGFAPESVTNGQLPKSPGLNHAGAPVPDRVMTRLGPQAAKWPVAVDGFKAAVRYVPENA